MKKTSIFLVLFFIITSNIFCQENNEKDLDAKVAKNEIYLCYGTPSPAGIVTNVFTDFFNALLSLADDGEEISKSFGTIAAGYNYNFSAEKSLGAFVNYENFMGVPTISVILKYTFAYNEGKTQAYSSVGAGCTFLGTEKILPMGDLTVIGVRFNINDNFNIFVENCFPITGLLKVGTTVKF